ncbi:hypothetical protein P7C73_g1603, partial [Tremellales sp. Uapishka_1]
MESYKLSAELSPHHSSDVKCVLGISSDLVATASRDQTVGIWKRNGATAKFELEALLGGHDAYINALAYIPSDSSSKEDGVNIETILHPCQTVWSVHPLPNGDIMTGGSDGIARIFTTDDSRMMGREDRDAYYAKVTEAMRHRTTAVAEEIVIDIDIKDDEPPIPLKFTHGQDPRRVAEDFGREHSISDNYVNQIEEFIRLHIA